ncbi:septum formation protein Maf [Aurantibacter crassamenti]|uniref:Maf family nucleotide pyrophosphatase n=1 Tax=Aurantibacter crassamenti TaxID=1837375 RepID=UPI00193AA080|nr:Maf family nucleotide pyrophosphatase [Aurantibacter crassamenti]MBM1106864.1 septum formation protein Maf [Aurantibacter crassamenti]
MLKEKLKNYEIILASGSPRRQEYFRQLDIDFKIKLKEIEEIYPPNLKASEITDYLAELKGKAFLSEIKPIQIVVTSDTIVWYNNQALGKPKDKQEAFNMLNAMSGEWHDVITSVCFNLSTTQLTKSCTTKVKFKELATAEIDYYIENYKPYDKAGAYGIQEWIGLIAIEEVQGSYANVVGLPTHLVYKMFNELIE